MQTHPHKPERKLSRSVRRKSLATRRQLRYASHDELDKLLGHARPEEEFTESDISRIRSRVINDPSGALERRLLREKLISKESELRILREQYEQMRIHQRSLEMKVGSLLHARKNGPVSHSKHQYSASGSHRHQRPATASQRRFSMNPPYMHGRPHSGYNSANIRLRDSASMNSTETEMFQEYSTVESAAVMLERHIRTIFGEREGLDVAVLVLSDERHAFYRPALGSGGRRMALSGIAGSVVSSREVQKIDCLANANELDSTIDLLPPDGRIAGFSMLCAPILTAPITALSRSHQTSLSPTNDEKADSGKCSSNIRRSSASALGNTVETLFSQSSRHRRGSLAVGHSAAAMEAIAVVQVIAKRPARSQHSSKKKSSSFHGCESLLAGGTIAAFGNTDKQLLLGTISRAALSLRNASLSERLERVAMRTQELVASLSVLTHEDGTDSLLHTCVENIRNLVSVERCTVWVSDRARGVLWTSTAADVEKISVPFGVGVVGDVAVSGMPALIDDAYADPRFDSSTDKRTGYQTRTILACPIFDPSKSKEVLGCIQCCNKLSSATFNKQDLETLEQVAAHVGATLCNAQLHDEAMRHKAHSEALLDISQSLSNISDTQSMIRTIMKKFRELLAVERCTVFVVDVQEQQIWSTVAEDTERIVMPINRGICGYTAMTGEAVLVSNAYEDDRFDSATDKRTGYVTRNILCVPIFANAATSAVATSPHGPVRQIKDKDGSYYVFNTDSVEASRASTGPAVIGVVQLLNKIGGGFDESDQEMVKSFASQVGARLCQGQLHEKAVVSQRKTEFLLHVTSQGPSEVTSNLQSWASPLIFGKLQSLLQAESVALYAVSRAECGRIYNKKSIDESNSTSFTPVATMLNGDSAEEGTENGPKGAESCEFRLTLVGGNPSWDLEEWSAQDVANSFLGDVVRSGVAICCNDPYGADKGDSCLSSNSSGAEQHERSVEKLFHKVDSKTNTRTRHVLVVPIVDNNGSVIGVCEAKNKPLRYRSGFSLDDQELLQGFATYVGIRLTNAKLYEKTMQATRKAQVLLDSAVKFSSTLDLNELLRQLMEMFAELLDAERCTLFLGDENSDTLWSKVWSSKLEMQEIRVPNNAGLVGWCASRGKLVNIRDAYTDSRFNSAIDAETGFRTRSVLCFPILSQQGGVLGVAQMLNKRNGPYFDESDEDLLRSFSAHVGIALQNAQNFARLGDEKKRNDALLRVCTILAADNVHEDEVIPKMIEHFSQALDATVCSVYAVDVSEENHKRAAVPQIAEKKSKTGSTLEGDVKRTPLVIKYCCEVSERLCVDHDECNLAELCFESDNLVNIKDMMTDPRTVGIDHQSARRESFSYVGVLGVVGEQGAKENLSESNDLAPGMNRNARRRRKSSISKSKYRMSWSPAGDERGLHEVGEIDIVKKDATLSNARINLVAAKSVLTVEDGEKVSDDFTEFLNRTTFRNVLCTPCCDETGNRQGVVLVANKRSGHFGEDEERMIRHFSKQVGIVLGNQRLREREAAKQLLEHKLLQFAPHSFAKS